MIYGAADAGLGWEIQDLQAPAGRAYIKVAGPLLFSQIVGMPLMEMQVIFIGQFLWAASITLVRISLLVFYRRLFPVEPFRIANTVLIGVNIAWFTSLFFVSQPFMHVNLSEHCSLLSKGTVFSYSWKTTGQPSIHYPTWLIVNGALDMVLDIMTLCIPLFVIRTLRISVKKKITVAGIFSLGFL